VPVDERDITMKSVEGGVSAINMKHLVDWLGGLISPSEQADVFARRSMNQHCSRCNC
jgi:hypothetical protein